MMGDIKLFQVSNTQVEELEGRSIAVEKSLQSIIENHLEIFLGVRFLATEYSTGKKHAGRIDTLGLDENNLPVIIEYKRSTNENVINQGLFYLDWLLDHKGEFTLLVMQKYGVDVAESIDWSNPRLLCVAGGFTKYDEHAVQQINRNIELYQYKQFGNDYLLLDLVNATKIQNYNEQSERTQIQRTQSKSVSDHIINANDELTDRIESLKSYLFALGDDVQMNTLKFYLAFKRIKNFACIEVNSHLKRITIYLKVDPTSFKLEPGFSRDVTNIGHYGTGNLELTLLTHEDLEKAKPFINMSYDKS